MNTNSVQQRQILGGNETNAEMWNSPYSGTGSTDGTVAGNSINGSLDRTANYVDSFLEADKPVNKLMKKGGLGILAASAGITGIGVIGGYFSNVAGVLSVGGAAAVIVVIAMLVIAALVGGGMKLKDAYNVKTTVNLQKKELEKQAQQNITLASTNTEKEFKWKQQMAEQNLITTASINDAKNQSRRKAANTALLEQDLNYANLGRNVATAMDGFNDVDGDAIQDASKHMQKLRLFGLEAARIDKNGALIK